MYYVYILYSESADKFYVGQTADVEVRLDLHNMHAFKGSYTAIATDWQVFHIIECENKDIALQIEKHIKAMRKRKYYFDLKMYPEITSKLILRFRGASPDSYRGQVLEGEQEGRHKSAFFVMYYVYILYSESADKFYVGQTADVEVRLDLHNIHAFKGSYAAIATDWQVFHIIECENKDIALQIEKHIKAMRKRKYYFDLKMYPEITSKLIEKIRGLQSR